MNITLNDNEVQNAVFQYITGLGLANENHEYKILFTKGRSSGLISAEVELTMSERKTSIAGAMTTPYAGSAESQQEDSDIEPALDDSGPLDFNTDD